MEKELLISKLNWFYHFELNQVDLYHSQSKAAKDDCIALAFERIAYIEQQHVDNLGSVIKKLGGKPSALGDIISPLIGSITGRALSLAGIQNMLKVNILLEQSVMSNYKKLIHQIRDQHDKELILTLQHNLIDEDLHAAWFANKLDEIEKDETS